MNRLAALAAFKLSLYLKPRVSEAFFKTYSRLISSDVTQEELDGYSELPEEESIQRMPELRRAFETMCV